MKACQLPTDHVSLLPTLGLGVPVARPRLLNPQLALMRQPRRNDSRPYLQSIELHQTRRDVRLARHYQYRLTEAALLEHQQNSRGAADVELGEGIVEQQ